MPAHELVSWKRIFLEQGTRGLKTRTEPEERAPCRLDPPNGDPAHAGTIITTRPNEMRGTDATRFYTEQNGWSWFFGAIHHYSDDLVGWHVAKRGDRWAALEPIPQSVRARPVGVSAKTSRAGSACAVIGARSTSPTPGSTR